MRNGRGGRKAWTSEHVKKTIVLVKPACEERRPLALAIVPTPDKRPVTLADRSIDGDFARATIKACRRLSFAELGQLVRRDAAACRRTLTIPVTVALRGALLAVGCWRGGD